MAIGPQQAEAIAEINSGFLYPCPPPVTSGGPVSSLPVLGVLVSGLRTVMVSHPFFTGLPLEGSLRPRAVGSGELHRTPVHPGVENHEGAGWCTVWGARGGRHPAGRSWVPSLRSVVYLETDDTPSCSSMMTKGLDGTMGVCSRSHSKMGYDFTLKLTEK